MRGRNLRRHFLLAQAGLASGITIRKRILYASVLPAGIASGIFDAVLFRFLSSAAPRYALSGGLVLLFFAALVWFSHRAHETSWAYDLSRNRGIACVWVVYAFLVALAVGLLIENGPSFVRAL